MMRTIMFCFLLQLLLAPAQSYGFSSFRTTALQIINKSNLENNCAIDLKLLINDLYTFKFWALKMLDANGRLHPGFLNGNYHLLGDYDECLSIKVNRNDRILEGQYCTVMMTIKNEDLELLKSFLDVQKILKLFERIDFGSFIENFPMVPLGICAPKSCSAKDVKSVLQNIVKKFQLPVYPEVDTELCRYKNKSVEFNNFDYLIYSFFMIIIAVIAGSTLYDIYLRISEKDSNVYVIFSVNTNLKQLLSTQAANSEIRLSCLNGIKVISNLSIILLHMYADSILISKNTLYIFTEYLFQTSNMFVWTAFFAVDTFLAISGFLTTYFYLKYSEKQSINLMLFYIARYIRLTPPLLATIFIHTSVLKIFADGPYGPFAIKKLTEECYSYWWTALLYLRKSADCAPQTWYLVVDTRMYLLAPIILFYIKKYYKFVVKGMITTFFLSLGYSVWITLKLKLGFNPIEYSVGFFDYIHFSVIHHLPSWLIGVYFGYLLYSNTKKISKNLNFLLWLASLCLMFKLVESQITFIRNEYNPYKAAIWNALAKPAWCLAVCFIIYSCATGNGGFINDFLSNYIFRVLGKLTYCIFLIHTSRGMIFGSNIKETIYFGNVQLLLNFCGALVVTLFQSVLLYLGFEAPIISLRKHWSKNNRTKTNTLCNV